MDINQLFQNGASHSILAPMAGYTDPAFRSICRQFGVGLTVTEMVSSKAIVMNNSQTKSLLVRFPNDTPSFVQIFGHEPSVMADSVQIPEIQAYDGVDINMGCPVKKIVKNGDGSALLENPKLASQVISAVKNAIGSKPLSVKFRLGVSSDSNVADFAKMCAQSGADFVTVHFRTRNQMYSGEPDFSTLSSICKCGVPVFANGNVATQQQYKQLTELGAYGVAIGRGALGRPYVFRQLTNTPYKMDVLETILTHINLLQQFLPQRVINNEMKKHIAFYLKGMRNAKQTVVDVTQSKSLQEVLHHVVAFFQQNPHLQVVEGNVGESL